MGVEYVIAYPFGGRVLALDWHLAVWSMLTPTNSSSTEIFRRSVPLDEAQTQMAEQALELGGKYILYIEDDTEPPTNALVELGRVLKTTDAMACGGIYTTRTDAPEPLVYMGPGQGSFWDWKPGEIFPCWAMGFGCMMVKTEVFRLMPKPWFKHIDTLEEARKYPDLIPNAWERDWKKIGMTSDMFFFTKFGKLGLKLMAHGGVLPKHWDMVKNKPCIMPEVAIEASR